MGPTVEIGIHVSLWTPNWTDPILGHMETAAQLGFHAVEIPLMEPSSVPAGKIKELAARLGLSVYCGTGLGPATDISSPDRETRLRGMKHLTACLQIASAIGSPSLEGVIHSSWGKHAPVTDEERKYSADILHQVADQAGSLGIQMALECINRYESSFLNSVKQGKEMLRLIDHPAVGLHLDTYHMNIEEQSIALALTEAGEDLFFLHFSENTRGYPGSGSLPWPDILDALKQMDYAGPLVMESYVLPDCQSGNDCSIWRPIEQDAEGQLKRSLDFITALWMMR